MRRIDQVATSTLLQAVVAQVVLRFLLLVLSLVVAVALLLLLEISVDQHFGLVKPIKSFLDDIGDLILSLFLNCCPTFGDSDVVGLLLGEVVADGKLRGSLFHVRRFSFGLRGDFGDLAGADATGGLGSKHVHNLIWS